MPGKTKVLERKPLSLAERTYLPQIATGLKTTLSNLFEKKVTREYPEQPPPIPDGYRGVPTLKDPNGREKCVSCQLCEFVCPPKAIRISPGELDETGETAHVEKGPEEFEINMLRVYLLRPLPRGLPRGGHLVAKRILLVRLHPGRVRK